MIKKQHYKNIKNLSQFKSIINFVYVKNLSKIRKAINIRSEYWLIIIIYVDLFI